MTAAADPSAAPDDRRARRNVAVLVAAQAVLGAQLPIHFVAGGLAGMMLAPNALLATLPISLTMIGTMTTAPWLSPFMARHGRRAGFVLGAFAGAAGALLCVFGLLWSNFALFLAGSYGIGVYMSAQAFYRFAATDTASDAFKPKAISYVLAGGLLSALIGPELVKLTEGATLIPFVATYMVAAILALGGSALFLALDIPRPPAPGDGAPTGRGRMQLLRDPAIAVSIVCAMVSYSLMTLVMTSTPLAVVGCGFGVGDASDVVRAHVIAMFGPSFFTGHLIARFGTTRIVGTGLGLLMTAGIVAMTGTTLPHFYAVLVLLGLGWNFGFIGATAMLGQHHRPEERATVQGMNDFMVFSCVTVASLASGGLMNSAADAIAGWSAVNLAMVPFLALAAGSLVWLRLQRPTRGA